MAKYYFFNFGIYIMLKQEVHNANEFEKNTMQKYYWNSNHPFVLEM